MLNRDPSLVPPAILPVTLRRALDRRRGIAALTTAVTTGLALGEARAARERLEEELRGALQARSVRLRDDRGQAVAPPPDAVCFDVPSPQGDSRARLEVIFDKSRPLDDWTCQLIDAATQLSAMVLELERAIGRVRLGSSPHHASDGAAPLIGSSEAIRRLRERIERVAGHRFHGVDRRREWSTAAPQFYLSFMWSCRRLRPEADGGSGGGGKCRSQSFLEN